MKFFFLTLLFAATARADLALDLLKSSDEARGSFEQGINWKAEIETSEDGETSTRGFSVRARGTDAYVEALSPARNQGEVYLFNDRTMWFFKPSLKKPVAISARQKLTGQAANGDIASTNYARDYTPTIEKTETIEGEKVHGLFLKAKSPNLTYDQIRYWISDKTRKGIKAEFLTLQGQPFKKATLEYKNKITVGGKTLDFVSLMTITDAQFENNKSTIKYSEPKATTLSKSLFNVNNLSR
jgi:outer membrane lipoprotein-sorting protein